jgi:Fic family protein
MARPFPDDALQSLINVVTRSPLGISMQEIEAALPLPANRRTLQRWLTALVEREKIIRIGKGRAVRYRPFESPAPSELVAHSPEPPVYRLPLSEPARQIAAHVRRAIQQRQPVGYRRAFLYEYQPNQTYYLPAAMRTELSSLGSLNKEAPAGTYARSLAHRLLVDLSWNSSRLEGNTYSLLETERLIAEGQQASGKNSLDAQMILNHKQAIEFLIDSAAEIEFNRFTIFNLHALLSENLLPDLQAVGRLRSIAVGIGHTTFMPLEGPQRIEECFDLFLKKASAIHDPFEQSLFALVHLPYLQAFEDVNKRVSRLAANIPLIKNNLCPLSFVDVPRDEYISALLGIYELNRIELLRDVFAWAYRRSCERYSAVRQTLGEPDPIRLRYRQFVVDAIAHVVRDRLNKQQAVALIHKLAVDQIPSVDRDRLIEIIEAELISLHEGSIARFRLRPSEFQAWRTEWH